MKKKITFLTIISAIVLATLSSCVAQQKITGGAQTRWQPLPSANETGLLADRVELWRKDRLWHVIESGYLLSGFEDRPGIHAWQGEHVGKWLHAATLAYEETRDEKLGKKLKETVERLIAAQEANGYMGTYGDHYTFMAMPENKSITAIFDDVASSNKKPARKKKYKGGWDTWTHRYNIYGLLTYERFHPDPRIVESCERMADLLIEVYGEGKYDLTKYGSRQGISSTTLLESMMMLYQRTQEERFLKFAEHIVAMSENNPKLRLMGNMLENGSVVYSGDGKAYQLMANLIGYLLLYENTGDEKYLTTVNNAWDNITENHLYTTGGPWSRKMPYNGNGECFALAEDFDPAEAKVETCSTTTWIQLNLHLLELTGQAKYANEAERAIFNALMAAQYKEGIDWCYYTKANEDKLRFEDRISCCASSGPRALEMFSHYLIGETNGTLSFASLSPSSVKFGSAKIKVTGNYPFVPKVSINFEKADSKQFALEFTAPAGSSLKTASVNGEDVSLTKNDRGFYNIERSWKTDDKIDIEFEYLLKVNIETPTEERKWIAFTYGPFALAQKIKKDAVVTEPFIGKDVKTKAPSQWLKPYPVKGSDMSLFRIENTKILVGPYLFAGSKKNGVRTYFEF